MKSINVIFALVILLCFAGCKKDPGANEVFMMDSKFNPSSITVSVGTTITWTNKERGSNAPVHTVTSDSGVFDSGDLFKDKSFSYTFTTKGVFRYHCKHHAGMTGTVVVQ